MTQQTINYDFSCITPTEFEAVLKMQQEGKFFNMLLEKTKQKLKRKGYSIQNEADEVSDFEVDQFNLNAINTFIRPQMAELKRQVGEDNIKLLSWRVTKTKFTHNKEAKIWDIEVTVSGMYQDDR